MARRSKVKWSRFSEVFSEVAIILLLIGTLTVTFGNFNFGNSSSQSPSHPEKLQGPIADSFSFDSFDTLEGSDESVISDSLLSNDDDTAAIGTSYTDSQSAGPESSGRLALNNGKGASNSSKRVKYYIKRSIFIPNSNSQRSNGQPFQNQPINQPPDFSPPNSNPGPLPTPDPAPPAPSLPPLPLPPPQPQPDPPSEPKNICTYSYDQFRYGCDPCTYYPYLSYKEQDKFYKSYLKYIKKYYKDSYKEYNDYYKDFKKGNRPCLLV